MNPLIKRADGTDCQSAIVQPVAQTGAEGIAPGLRDGASASEEGGDGDSGGDPDQRRRGPTRRRRGSAAHARDRADAGEEPDLELALAQIRRFTSFARRPGGGA